MRNIKDTLQELEFYKILNEIAVFAYDEVIKNKILHTEILENAQAKQQLLAVNEYLSSFSNQNSIAFGAYESIEKELKLLLIENFRWEITAFLKTKNLVTLINNLIFSLEKYKEYYPNLLLLLFDIQPNKEILKEIDAIINRFGDVKPDASIKLKSIKHSISEGRKSYQDSFNASLVHCKQLGLLDEIGESVIDGIRVLAVNSAMKKRVKGFTLGISKTGSISYILPENCKKIINTLKELEEQEKHEIEKILLELTQKIALYHDELQLFQQKAFLFDELQAKARYAELINACLPTINEEKNINLIDAFHPILWLNNQREHKKTIPQHITLTKKQRIIAISGPNAGGKSITLKTVGLLQVMLQCGILVSVHPKSEMSFFKHILTDIGDNQSIENQLSTYSSRLKKMSKIIKVANAESLLLIDEFGTGSDPELGGALAESFLEYFYEKKSFAILTTHYTNIKIKAEELPNAINASMLFDEQTLEPIYKLELGQAGSSFTFEVAEKNNIPWFLIRNAKKKLVSDTLDLDKTIIKLQKEKYQVEKLKNVLTSQKEKSEIKVENIEKQQQELQNKLLNFNLLYDKEQKTIFLGRKLEQLIESYSKGNTKKEVLKQFLKIIEQEKFKKSQDDNVQQTQKIISKVRQKVKKELSEKKEKIEEIATQIVEKKKEKLQVGMRVKIAGSASVATIDKLEKKKAVLNYGKFTTKIDIEQLEIV